MSTTLQPEAIDVGLHRDLPMGMYLALPYMSASRLEVLRRSPLQLRYAMEQPPRRTAALERGTALHMAVLEPLRFAAEYAVSEPCGAQLASGKRKGEPCGNPGLHLHTELGWLCGQHIRGFGSGIDTTREILTPDEHARVTGMRDAILGHARARTLFDGRGDFEATIVWDDPETGVRCRIRPDRLVERAGMLVDVKTTVNAERHAFASDAERRGYWRKMALYRRGLRAIGWPYTVTAVLAVESDAPHDLAPYLLDEDHVDAADREVGSLLRLFAQCVESDTWPGYASGDDGFLTLDRPRWALEAA